MTRIMKLAFRLYLRGSINSPGSQFNAFQTREMFGKKSSKFLFAAESWIRIQSAQKTIALTDSIKVWTLSFLIVEV